MSISYAGGHANADYSMHAVAKRVLASCKNMQAYAYAKGMMRLSGYDHEAIHAQVLYMLSNMSHWRGDEAKECRALCKEWLAEYDALFPR
jgi:hypothetical protein